MRRWHLLSRLRRDTGRHDSDRCILVVEELEAREVLSPIVFAPATAQTSEDVAYTFSGSGAFSVGDSDEGTFGQDYTAVVTALTGIITVDPKAAASFSVGVANNGTTAVTLTGLVYDLDNFLFSAGFSVQPPAHYPTYASGDIEVTVSLTDSNSGESDEDSATLQVLPVASDPGFAVQSSGEVWAPSAGFVFPAGFVAVSPWPDLDGSETVTVTFSLDAANADQFTLSAGGVPLTPLGTGQWQVSGTDPAALQATLDSLVLAPPAGFTGRASLLISADISDDTSYSNESTATDGHSLGSASVPLRFFIGGSVTTPQVFGSEGGTLDLGGQFVAADPDELDGDTHTLALTVASGTLTLDPAAVPPELTANSTVAANGSTTILLTGTIAAINQFLASAGSMTYTAGSAYFSGVVPLTLTLTNYPGDPAADGPPSKPGGQNLSMPAPGAFTGVSALSFVPVAGHAVPSAVDVVTNQDTRVAVSITFPALADTDGSESVLLVVTGVPAGASFNHGTDLGGGEWALSSSDLAGLTFTPPAGASGAYLLTVKTVVTDAAPALGLVDTATDSTAFTVTVVPAAVSQVVASLPPDSDGADVLDSDSAVGESATSVDPDTTTDSDTDEPEVQRSTANFVNAYASSVVQDGQPGNTESRVSNSPPSQGSLFAQAEAPLPSYTAGDRHPLPPVLPLDQTLPVAGFTESGGDSFALIDKLYRDAAADRSPANKVGATPAPEDPATAVVTAHPRRTELVPVVVLTTESEDDAGPPIVAEATAGEWRIWSASAAIVAALAAWGWLGRNADSRLGRVTRSFLRTLHRRTTQRTA